MDEMTLDEKVDEILKYQRRLHHLAIARIVFSFLTFFVLVILPIFGFYYLMEHLRDNIGLNLSELSDTLQKVKEATDIGAVDDLKNLLK